MANTKDCYQYTDSGLKNVWLVNGFTKKQTPYGEAVGIDNLDKPETQKAFWLEKVVNEFSLDESDEAVQQK